MIYFSKKLENSEYKCISLKKNEENKQLEIVAELSTGCGISLDRLDFSLSIDDAKKIVEFLSNYTTNADVGRSEQLKCRECEDASGWYGDEEIRYNCETCNPDAL